MAKTEVNVAIGGLDFFSYYENLYRRQNVAYHIHHEEVSRNMEMFEEDRNFEDEVYNVAPSRKEIAQAVEEKKGGKVNEQTSDEI